MAGGMIVVGGENLVDLIQVEGGTGLTYQAKPGGSPFNCAMAIGRQGSRVGYLTPISTDTFGQLLAETLEASGVELLAERRAEPTSLALVSLSDGVPSYQFYRENTAERMVSPAGLRIATPETMQALYVGSLALTDGKDADVWGDFYCEAHTTGVFTALDPNIRPAFIQDRDSYVVRLDRALMRTDLLKLSDEDLAWLYPGEAVYDAAEMLRKRTSAKLLVVTLGAEGAFVQLNGRKVSVLATPVSSLRDTVGAGDTFMATLLAHLSRNNLLTSKALAMMDIKPMKDLLSWAARAAALNCERDGCDPPTFSNLESSFNKR